LKAKYDSCFQLWFSEKFLKGDSSEDMCKPLFIVYQDCVRKAIKEQNLNLDEIDKEVLGTFNEKQDPKKQEQQQQQQQQSADSEKQ